MFDSKEYVLRWSNANFIEAITTGHTPLHSGYVFSFWPLFQLLQRLNLDPTLGVLVGQTFLDYLTIIFFYKTVEILINKSVALRSAILLGILPIFWLVNEVIMMETTYLCYWVMAYYFLVRFSKSVGEDKHNLVLASVFWILSFLTHTVVILWIPLFLITVLLYRPKAIKMIMVAGGLAILIASVINAGLLALANRSDFFDGWYLLYGAKFNEHAHFSFDPLGVLRYVRNWLTPLGYNNTWILLSVSFILLGRETLRNWKKSLLLWSWVLPSMVANQWWDSLLFGRHALIASLALVLVIAEQLLGWKFKLLIGSVFLISLGGINLLKKPIPYVSLAETVKALPEGGLYIESHFARPQIDGVYNGQVMFVDEPGWNIAELPATIQEYLDNKKPVFISGQALSEPYGLFCGPVLHNLSLSYKNQLILKDLEGGFRVQKMVSLDPEINLEIYQITNGEGERVEINQLDDSRRRLDYFDPLRFLTSQFKLRP